MYLSIPMYTYVHNFTFQFINSSNMILSDSSFQFSTISLSRLEGRERLRMAKTLMVSNLSFYCLLTIRS